MSIAPPRSVRKIRRIAPAIRIRDTNARAGPAMMLGKWVLGYDRDGRLTWRHCDGEGFGAIESCWKSESYH